MNVRIVFGVIVWMLSSSLDAIEMGSFKNLETQGTTEFSNTQTFMYNHLNSKFLLQEKTAGQDDAFLRQGTYMLQIYNQYVKSLKNNYL